MRMAEVTARVLGFGAMMARVIVVVVIGDEEGVDVVVVAASMMVRDDLRAGHGRRRDERDEHGSDGGPTTAQGRAPTTVDTGRGAFADVGFLTDAVRHGGCSPAAHRRSGNPDGVSRSDRAAFGRRA
jgi:hypothetical protein